MLKFHTRGGGSRDLEVFFYFYLFRHRLLGGVPSQVAGCRLQVTGYRVQATDFNLRLETWNLKPII
jgi:hypothetical protein